MQGIATPRDIILGAPCTIAASLQGIDIPCDEFRSSVLYAQTILMGVDPPNVHCFCLTRLLYYQYWQELALKVNLQGRCKSFGGKNIGLLFCQFTHSTWKDLSIKIQQ